MSHGLAPALTHLTIDDVKCPKCSKASETSFLDTTITSFLLSHPNCPSVTIAFSLDLSKSHASINRLAI